MLRTIKTISTKLALALALCVVSIPFGIIAQAAPMSAGEIQIMDIRASWWRGKQPNCRASSDDGATVSPSGDNVKDAMAFFVVTHHLSVPQAAGLVGNFAIESDAGTDLVPKAFNSAGGNLGAYGIAQWRGDRQQTLRDKTGGDTLMVQLAYVWEELNGAYYSKTTLTPLKAATTPEDAAKIVDDNYEVSGGGSTGKRQTTAKKFADDYDGGLSSGGSSACSGGSTATIVGGVAWPVDIKFWDEHADWFTKPHHDHPAADIPVPSDTPVYSMLAGKVTKAPVGGDCGTGVMIVTDDITMIYCHGSDGGSVEGAKVGDTVTAGQLIMHSDNTGYSTGPHLHVGIRIAGVDYCPQSVFKDLGNGVEPDFSKLTTKGCVGGTVNE